MAFIVRGVEDGDIDALFALESKSYPADEAATLESLRYRAKNAREFFKVACSGDEIVGFVCGTCCNGSTLHHESMSAHVDGGTTLCIHSVVVAPERRRQGIATWMLRTYLRQIHENVAHIALSLLIAKEHLLGLYTGAGFTCVGLSSVVHGKDPWFELKYKFPARPQLPLFQVDAFSAKAFGGNPAAVMVLSANYVSEEAAGALVPDSWLQAMATENNLSETAFLQPLTDGRWRIRWFSPGVEIKLCGHATLASAHALVEQGYVPSCQTTIDFTSMSGPLSTSIDGSWITLDFPSEATAALDAGKDTDEATATLVRALSLSGASAVKFVGRNRLDMLVELDRDAFDSIKPDFALLESFGPRAVSVTAAGRDSESADFVSRLFAPAVAINEDPVTGSAHCFLTPYWAAKLGKPEMEAWQTSARHGVLKVADRGDRVNITGQAVTVLVGTLMPSACPAATGPASGAGMGAGAGAEA